MGRNKKKIINKEVHKISKLVNFRLSKSDLYIYNKAKEKINISEWFKRSLRRDFGGLITETDQIRIATQELQMLQSERDQILREFNSSYEQKIFAQADKLKRLKEEFGEFEGAIYDSRN